MKNLFCIATLFACLAASYWVKAQPQEDELQAILQKLDKGETVEHLHIHLSDINFSTGTAKLEPGTKSYLDKVARLLNLAPNMNLLIKGHTDNTGTTAVNEKLSTERAKAVKDYLVQQNISKERLEAKGLGSKIPVSDNLSPEGRAKNRRVELEILKKETVKTLQDFIVFRNGEKMGVTVSRYDKEQITYRQFSNAAEQQLSTKGVEKIVFADGREVYFDIATNPPVQIQEDKPSRQISFRPFAESAAFHQGQFIVGAGIGAGNNVSVRYKDNKTLLPPVWMVIELPLKHNLGIGLSGGIMRWEPKSTEGVNYTYFSISPRLAYHFNLAKEVDLYGGVAVTGRFATLEYKRQGSAISLRNNQFDASLFAGLRYYFNNAFGIYGEYGDDNVACARLGLALRFGM